MFRFEGDDNPYLKWIRTHPAGLVLNTRRAIDPAYMVLHRADCSSIAPDKSYRAGQFVERDYIKICADTVSELERWVAANGRPDGTFSLECARCDPRAPRAVTVLAREPSLQEVEFVSEKFHSIFKRAASPAARAKFLSRLFGIFSEEIVSLWAHDDRAPYESLGRPTIKTRGDNRGHTLDFTLRERLTAKVFVAEMKCEIEYQNYKYFTLENVEQLTHHKKPAFDAFLKAARHDSDQTVFVGGKEVKVDGAILIWGLATAQGRKAVMEAKGFHDVLNVGKICHDLMSWNHTQYQRLVVDRRQWANELFTGLLEGVDAQPGVRADGSAGGPKARRQSRGST